MEFIREPGVIFDVRSPKEYNHAHIPGAINLPLFTDEERALVGTCYKQKGKSPAIELGLKIVGPKLFTFVSQAKELSDNLPIKIYCARGGMRSSSMAWLLNTAQLPSVTLKGGYKKYRNWVLSVLRQPRKLAVIGGFTGSGKTHILKELAEIKEQIIDLETLAHHKGSSFGMDPDHAQPSIEQFENKIAHLLFQSDPMRPLWVEDESRLIGACKIPDHFFAMMRASPLFKLDKSQESRVKLLENDYINKDKDLLIEATARLTKRLGLQRTKDAINHIQEGRIREAIIILLMYYDATYTYGLSKRVQPITSLSLESASHLQWAEALKELYYDKYGNHSGFN